MIDWSSDRMKRGGKDAITAERESCHALLLTPLFVSLHSIEHAPYSSISFDLTFSRPFLRQPRKVIAIEFRMKTGVSVNFFQTIAVLQCILKTYYRLNYKILKEFRCFIRI